MEDFTKIPKDRSYVLEYIPKEYTQGSYHSMEVYVYHQGNKQITVYCIYNGGTSYKRTELYFQSGRKVHREDGPAYIEFYDDRINCIEWYTNNNDITEEVNLWIKENNYPDWQEWTDVIKTHFKMRFE